LCGFRRRLIARSDVKGRKARAEANVRTRLPRCVRQQGCKPSAHSAAFRTWTKLISRSDVSVGQKTDKAAALRAAAGLASKAQVQVSYAIGVAKPTSIMVTTFGTGKISDERLGELVSRHFDLRPKGIIQMLDLLRPIYTKTAAYGHFGREEPEFTWERTDRAAALRAAAGLK